MTKGNSLVHTTTSRGFTLYEFVDRYGESCSLQESSLATEDAIWLGIDAIDPTNRTIVVNKKDAVMGRMHLTVEHVKELLPLLTYFVEHGTLPPPDE